MSENPYAWLDKSLATIHRANWYRTVKTIEGLPGAKICVEGREAINFASNDYLGLAGDKRLIAAATTAIQELGTGSTGSRLLSGHRQLHRDLENAIAGLKQTDDAIVFSSGYLANLGTISAVVGQRDLILSDVYNHSSLKNGAILSGAKILEYPHTDMNALETLLKQHRSHYRRCLIITDSVFSMDGDLCPLPELADLADGFNCMLLVDEAHATGVFGHNGAGCVEYFGCRGRQIIQIGTLSKAVASLGGYVAGSRKLIDFLRNRAPTWIYTTALSPGDTAAALTAIQIIQTESDRRRQLWQNIHDFKQLFSGSSLSFPILPSRSPIISIQLPLPTTALELSQYLANGGFFAPAIRPPTVPTSRIRISLMATHTYGDLENFVNQLRLYQGQKI